MDPEFRDLERHHEDLLDAGYGDDSDAPEAEACEQFVGGGGSNLLGQPSCRRCGFTEADHR